ncbi:histone acetyltransferase MYST2 [Pyrenophora tritici-repentis Pt-1C-BFP]|uniref:Histone acetyltransferase n=1 Tax=Pyrenophora tritici-repentis (strain Pt-1C-BFP) TaxID=426418 RepID=B2VYH7_PYRTR|nr:histone acetyltransferase MYST2 [Pyrenophora tritici-repentis Pt-1C-BFP]EDU44990.1 histone acetyltransferase MYST2 [Pyrenophora tritici-repentis Pt-1C-BFP]
MAELMGQTASNAEMEDIDADGEYEMDDVEYEHALPAEVAPDADGHTTDAEGSDVDAEGEEVDDEDEAEPVGAVKIALRRVATSDEEEDYEGDDAARESSDAKSSDGEVSSSADSEEENQWQASVDGEEDEVIKSSNPNVCVYCRQDEDNDPSPEFEEYLSCAVCGDNDAKRWRCTECVNNFPTEDEEEEEPSARRRRSSQNKLTKELLPSHRGVDPEGHSIFKELILPDEAEDGVRSLRKRKTSHETETPMPSRQTRKKRRPSEATNSGAEPSIPAVSPRPPSRSVRSVRSVMDGHESGAEAEHTGSDREGTRLRPARARRGQPKRTDKRPLAWIEEAQGQSLIIAFHLNNEKVQKIVTSKPKKKIVLPTREQERQERRRQRDRERRERNRRAAQEARGSPDIPHYPTIHVQHPTPFAGFTDREPDETKVKPYGGVLSEADADTSKTYPSQADRKRFDDARIKAEEEWREKQAALYPPEAGRSHKQAATASKIKCVNFGGWEIDTWHAAPYPEEYSKNRVLYICEFCLKYMNSDYVAWRHKLKCPAKHPPGDEIYRDGRYSFFEVDGRKNPVYCQNLCLLAKLFLGSKTLYYDVEPFLFYVMTENDNFGCHFVGYFSKEKRPSSLNNVSCILVLPIHMRKGYGQYLIEFSYLLTRVERKTGSPEKPLSDMGLVSYRKYWRLVLCEELLQQKAAISISAISDRTGMTPDDIVSALEGLRALVRDPVTKKYALRLDLDYFKSYIEKCNAAGNPKINPECLIWTPYVMGRLGQYEDGPALQTVQQRDEVEEEEKPVPEEGVQMGKAKANGTGDEADPFGPIPTAEESVNGGSPAPGTPVPNGSTVALAGSHMDEPAIPPSRYEIFPPVPGQPAQRRRPGRPFGSRRRTSTPNRVRNTALSIHTAPVSKIQLSPSRGAKNLMSHSAPNGALTPGTISLRRTRSRLGESVTNGDDVEDGGAVKAVLTNGRRSTRSSASSRGSIDLKGKGKALPIEEEHDEDVDADADGDYDEEEGDMDIDAEGEEDDDVIMADA